MLTENEKDLILRIDVKGESQADVAKSLRKSPSTISQQHKKANQKFTRWLREEAKQEETSVDEDFEKEVFRRFNRGEPPNKVIEELGNADLIMKLWKVFRTLREDDYARILDLLRQYYIEVDLDSKYPVSEILEVRLLEHAMLSEATKEIWNRLEKLGCAKGLDYYAWGSVSEAFLKFHDYALKVVDERENLKRRVKDLERQLERSRVY